MFNSLCTFFDVSNDKIWEKKGFFLIKKNQTYFDE